MGAGFRWAPLPRRLLEDERVLELPLSERGLLFSLYAGCDKHGRFPAAPRALARAAAVPVNESVSVLALARLGLVTLYDCNGMLYGQLDGYDEDAPAALSRSSDDRFPAPEQGQVRDTTASHPEYDAITTPSRSHHDLVTTASRSHRDGVTMPSDCLTVSQPSDPHGDSASGHGVTPSRSDHDAITTPSSPRRDETRRDEKPAIKAGEDAHARECIDRVLAEYQDRANGGTANTRAHGRHFAGFCGPDGVLEIEAQLESLWERHPGLAEVVCRNIWGFVDERGGLGRCKGGLAGAIGECAKKHGGPSVMAQIAAQMRGLEL